MRLFSVIIVLLVSFLFAVSNGSAQIPNRISYQGVLVTSAGNPVTDGNYDLRFEMYDLPAAGILMHSETLTGVPVVSGGFSVQLGSVNPLPAIFGEALFVEITALAGPDIPSAVTFAPRTELTSAPYALAPWATNGSSVYYSDGPVGIGTQNPLNELEVAGSDYVYVLSSVNDNTDAGFHARATSVGSEAGGINQYAIQIRNSDNSGDFAINEDYIGGVFNPTTRFKIENESGNIGIGTENPASKLDVAGTAQMSGFKMPTGAANGLVLTSDATGVGSWQAVSGGSLGGAGSANYLSKFSAPSTLQSSGVYDNGTNVGIGTTAPDNKFHVVGGPNDGIKIEVANGATNNAQLILSAGSEPQYGQGAVYQLNAPSSTVDPNALLSFNRTNGPMILGTNNAERMRIVSGGNIGIGLTSPDNKLHVLGAANDGIKIEAPNGTSSSAQLILSAGSEPAAGQGAVIQLNASSNASVPNGLFVYNRTNGPLVVATNNVERMRISNTGSVGIGTATPSNILTVVQGSATDPIADAWTTYSSRRWKENIEPIHDPIGTIRKLRGVTYDWKGNSKHDIGLIAEEVGEVLPEIVQYEENGIDARSVDYARLVALLIEAVKAQQDEIDGLKNEVRGLTHESKQESSRELGMRSTPRTLSVTQEQ